MKIKFEDGKMPADVLYTLHTLWGSGKITNLNELSPGVRVSVDSDKSEVEFECDPTSTLLTRLVSFVKYGALSMQATPVGVSDDIIVEYLKNQHSKQQLEAAIKCVWEEYEAYLSNEALNSVNELNAALEAAHKKFEPILLTYKKLLRKRVKEIGRNVELALGLTPRINWKLVDDFTQDLSMETFANYIYRYVKRHVYGTSEKPNWVKSIESNKFEFKCEMGKYDVREDDFAFIIPAKVQVTIQEEHIPVFKELRDTLKSLDVLLKVALKKQKAHLNTNATARLKMEAKVTQIYLENNGAGEFLDMARHALEYCCSDPKTLVEV